MRKFFKKLMAGGFSLVTLVFGMSKHNNRSMGNYYGIQR